MPGHKTINVLHFQTLRYESIYLSVCHWSTFMALCPFIQKTPIRLDCGNLGRLGIMGLKYCLVLIK